VTPAFLTVPEVAKRLSICNAQAYKLVRNGTIPSTKFGAKIVVPARWVDDEAARIVEEWRAKQADAA
jgi:excisionase family DNA binding protein